MPCATDVLRFFKFKGCDPLTACSPDQLRSRILALLFTIIQLIALVWYLVSYFPMGSTGLRFAARVGQNRVAAWMT